MTTLPPNKSTNVRSVLEYVPYFRDKIFAVHVERPLVDSEELVDALLDLDALQEIGVRPVLIVEGTDASALYEHTRVCEMRSALVEAPLKGGQLVRERVREILKISQEPVSLETPIGEEEDSHLGDFIQDDNVPVPADAAAFSLLKEQLNEVLGTLTEREQKVLRLRFGLDDGRARTLEEVGKEFNVTRERIRQIEAKALRKLRHPSRSRKLKDYLD